MPEVVEKDGDGFVDARPKDIQLSVHFAPTSVRSAVEDQVVEAPHTAIGLSEAGETAGVALVDLRQRLTDPPAQVLLTMAIEQPLEALQVGHESRVKIVGFGRAECGSSAHRANVPVSMAVRV